MSQIFYSQFKYNVSTVAKKGQVSTGLCADVALEFLPPVTTARPFDEDKY